MQNKKELMAFKPTNPHIPSKGKKINITKPHFPSSTTQAERLGPTFKYLRDVMDRKVVMQQDMQGVLPCPAGAIKTLAFSDKKFLICSLSIGAPVLYFCQKVTQN